MSGIFCMSSCLSLPDFPVNPYMFLSNEAEKKIQLKKHINHHKDLSAFRSNLFTLDFRVLFTSLLSGQFCSPVSYQVSSIQITLFYLTIKVETETGPAGGEGPQGNLWGQLFRSNVIGLQLLDWINLENGLFNKQKKDSEIGLDYVIQSCFCTGSNL